MSASAVDTSVLVAASIREHEFHHVASGPSREATYLLGPVLVETWSVLRRAYRLDAVTVREVLAGYLASRAVVVPGGDVYRSVIDAGARLRLAGNVHDKLIVETCVEHSLTLTTADAGMAALADTRIEAQLLAMPGPT